MDRGVLDLLKVGFKAVSIYNLFFVELSHSYIIS
jgi:hypothetical protein